MSPSFRRTRHFWATRAWPPAIYTGLNLTFSNPQLTIYNASGATIGSGANACANKTVCQLNPSASDMSLTLSPSPLFPLTLTASSPLAFKLDIHLDTVIQQDLSVNLGATNGVTVSQLPLPGSGEPIPGLGHLIGTIQSLTTSSGTTSGFTLQTLFGKSFPITINSSTTYNYPTSVCSADNVTCLATQQVVKIALSLQPDGTLLASEVNYVQPAGQIVVEGNIIRLRTSNGNTLMDLIVQNGPEARNILPFGRRVTVTVPSTGVTYAVDSGTFSIPSGLSFSGVTDLFVGQEVSVVVQGSVTPAAASGGSTPWAGPGSAAFTTNSITLEPSQITGTVGTVDASDMSFTLSTFPNFFVPPAASATSAPAWAPFNFDVQTTSATTFTNFTPDSIMGVAANDVVSVQGWLFLAPTNNNVCIPFVGCGVQPTIAAETVIDRPGVTPLF